MNNFIPKYVFRGVIIVFLTVLSAVMMFSFSSCSLDSLGTQGTSQASTNSDSDDDDEDEDDEDDEDDPDDCEENSGDPCKDDHYCSATCENIYKGSQRATRSCKDRGDKTVDFLQEVHDRLMGDDAGRPKFKDRSPSDIREDLEAITDDDDDVGHDELKCYLQIGSGKYIDWLKAGLTDDSVSSDTEKDQAGDRLKETLRWIVEDQETANVLADLNSGSEILQALLETLAGYYDNSGSTDKGDKRADSRCIADDGYYHNRPQTPYDQDRDGTVDDVPKNNNIHKKRNQAELDQALWWFKNGDLKIWYQSEDNNGNDIGKEGEIEIRESDKNLFSALSCFHKIDSDDHNIFSYSAQEDNDKIFEMAFNLLIESCEETDLKKEACARSLMCWSSWQLSCFNKGQPRHAGYECAEAAEHRSDSNNTSNLWSDIEDYEDELEKDGSSNYNNCTAKGFYSFFD